MEEQSFAKAYQQRELHIRRIRQIKAFVPIPVILLVRCLKISKDVLSDRGRSLKHVLFPAFQYRGYCPCCRRKTVFISEDSCFREMLHCIRCYSLPRDRQVFKYADPFLARNPAARVLEFAPQPGSHMNNRKIGSYTVSHYLPDKQFGQLDEAFYNEDIQRTSFNDGSFDLIIHEDILEHINDPFQAIRDNLRILADKGVLLFTCPIQKEGEPARRRVSINEDGTFVYLEKPVYHGNPVDDSGSLVFWDFGPDFERLLKDMLPANIRLEHIAEADVTMGILGEGRDLFCLRKLPQRNSSPGTGV